MYKEDSALNNLQWLIYLKTKPTNQPINQEISVPIRWTNHWFCVFSESERAAAGIGLHVNIHKTEYMCYNQTGDISTLDGTSLKLVDKFTYLGSSISSTEKDIDTRLMKA